MFLNRLCLLLVILGEKVLKIVQGLSEVFINLVSWTLSCVQMFTFMFNFPFIESPIICAGLT